MKGNHRGQLKNFSYAEHFHVSYRLRFSFYKNNAVLSDGIVMMIDTGVTGLII